MNLSRFVASFTLLLFCSSAVALQNLPNFGTKPDLIQNFSVTLARDGSNRLELYLEQYGVRNRVTDQLRNLGLNVGTSGLIIYLPISNTEALKYRNNYLLSFNSSKLRPEERKLMEVVYKDTSGNNRILRGIGPLRLWTNYAQVDSLFGTSRMGARNFLELELRLSIYENAGEISGTVVCCEEDFPL